MPGKEFGFLLFQFIKVGGTIKICRTFHYTLSFFKIFQKLAEMVTSSISLFSVRMNVNDVLNI